MRFTGFFAWCMSIFGAHSTVIYNFTCVFCINCRFGTWKNDLFRKWLAAKPQRQRILLVTLHLRQVRSSFFQQGLTMNMALPSPLPSADIGPNQVIQLGLVFFARWQLIRHTIFHHPPARIDCSCVNPQCFSGMSFQLFDELVLSMWTCIMNQLVTGR